MAHNYCGVALFLIVFLGMTLAVAPAGCVVSAFSFEQSKLIKLSQTKIVAAQMVYATLEFAFVTAITMVLNVKL
jgi:hypothetical protein